MSRIRIVGGTITKTTGGDYNIYSDGNIVYNSAKVVTETSDAGIVYGEPKSSPPVSKLHFVDGWWALDRQGEKKINRAIPGMTVFFHLKTKEIPNGNAVFLSLFDEDNHEKEEEDNDKEDEEDYAETSITDDTLDVGGNYGEKPQGGEGGEYDDF